MKRYIPVFIICSAGIVAGELLWAVLNREYFRIRIDDYSRLGDLKVAVSGDFIHHGLKSWQTIAGEGELQLMELRVTVNGVVKKPRYAVAKGSSLRWTILNCGFFNPESSALKFNTSLGDFTFKSVSRHEWIESANKFTLSCTDSNDEWNISLIVSRQNSQDIARMHLVTPNEGEIIGQ